MGEIPPWGLPSKSDASRNDSDAVWGEARERSGHVADPTDPTQQRRPEDGAYFAEGLRLAGLPA